jgi:hypothetical protein
MKKIVMLLAVFAMTLPLCALKPVEDSVLSTVSGPDSLGVNPSAKARIVLHLPLYSDKFKGIGRMLLADMAEISDAILYGEEDDSGRVVSGLNRRRLVFYADPQQYKNGYLSSDDLETDQAYGKQDPMVSYFARPEANYTLGTPLNSRHSIDYVLGSYRSTDEPVYWVSKPYGGPEMRSHYLNDAKTAIQPNSWVDIKPR